MPSCFLILSPRPKSWNAVLRLRTRRVKVWTSPARDRIEMDFHPVTSFVCAFVPGTTRQHAHARFNCLLKLR